MTSSRTVRPPTSASVRQVNQDSILVRRTSSSPSPTAWVATRAARSRRPTALDRPCGQASTSAPPTPARRRRAGGQPGRRSTGPAATRDLKGMGTTLCALALVQTSRTARSAWRSSTSATPGLYLPPSGETDLVQLTEDHSLVATPRAPGPAHPRGGRGPPAAQHPHPGPRHRRAPSLVDSWEVLAGRGDRYLHLQRRPVQRGRRADRRPPSRRHATPPRPPRELVRPGQRGRRSRQHHRRHRRGRRRRRAPTCSGRPTPITGSSTDRSRDPADTQRSRPPTAASPHEVADAGCGLARRASRPTTVADGDDDASLGARRLDRGGWPVFALALRAAWSPSWSSVAPRCWIRRQHLLRRRRRRAGRHLPGPPRRAALDRARRSRSPPASRSTTCPSAAPAPTSRRASTRPPSATPSATWPTSGPDRRGQTPTTTTTTTTTRVTTTTTATVAAADGAPGGDDGGTTEPK